MSGGWFRLLPFATAVNNKPTIQGIKYHVKKKILLFLLCKLNHILSYKNNKKNDQGVTFYLIALCSVRWKMKLKGVLLINNA